MGFVGLDEGGDIVGIGWRGDIMSIFIKFEIVLLAVAECCLDSEVPAFLFLFYWSSGIW